MKSKLASAFFLLMLVPGHAANVESGRNMKNFSPNAFGFTAVCNAGTVSQSVAVIATDEELYVYNAGNSLAFIRWGVGPQTAVATDLPIPPGVPLLFSKNLNGLADTVACISPAAGTEALYLTSGFGR
jgi:hypothetical protein